MPIDSVRRFFLLLALFCVSLIGTALYLQEVKNYPPCPLCILQRLAFIAIGFFALLAACHRSQRTVWHGLSMLSSVTGMALASYHVYVITYPVASCGMDPLESWVNQLPTAHWWPTLFYADGLCSTALPPVLGLTVPVWSLLGFIGLSGALAWAWKARVKKELKS